MQRLARIFNNNIFARIYVTGVLAGVVALYIVTSI